jgi:hypothetical protein
LSGTPIGPIAPTGSTMMMCMTCDPLSMMTAGEPPELYAIELPNGEQFSPLVTTKDLLGEIATSFHSESRETERQHTDRIGSVSES